MKNLDCGHSTPCAASVAIRADASGLLAKVVLVTSRDAVFRSYRVTGFADGEKIVARALRSVGLHLAQMQGVLPLPEHSSPSGSPGTSTKIRRDDTPA